MVSKKEKREIAFIISAVLLVAVVGFGLQALVPQNSGAIAGAAISLDSESPTYSGMLYLLEDACFQVEANSPSTCDELCLANSAICIPLEDNCDTNSSDYLCHCCEDLSE